MASSNPELKVIPVAVAQARQYIDAIEGLVFDPQPFRPSVPEVVERTTGMFASFLEALRKKPRVERPVRDPAGRSLNGRYNRLISDQYYQLTEGPREQDPPKEERVGVYGSPLSVINERPSLLVDAGSSRTYDIDLRLVRDERIGIIFSFLHLQEKGAPYTEASLFMCSPGMLRLERDGIVPNELYTPAFAEQQRLIAVNDLLRKHMKPTRAW